MIRKIIEGIQELELRPTDELKGVMKAEVSEFVMPPELWDKMHDAKWFDVNSHSKDPVNEYNAVIVKTHAVNDPSTKEYPDRGYVHKLLTDVMHVSRKWHDTLGWYIIWPGPGQTPETFFDEVGWMADQLVNKYGTGAAP